MSVLDAEAAVLGKNAESNPQCRHWRGGYLQMAQARKEFYQNLSSVPTTYGTGLNGHLGLGMFPDQCLIRAGQIFTVPVDPEPYDLAMPPQRRGYRQRAT